jgi:hypothetical protein
MRKGASDESDMFALATHRKAPLMNFKVMLLSNTSTDERNVA